MSMFKQQNVHMYNSMRTKTEIHMTLRVNARHENINQ